MLLITAEIDAQRLSGQLRVLLGRRIIHRRIVMRSHLPSPFRPTQQATRVTLPARRHRHRNNLFLVRCVSARSMLTSIVNVIRFLDGRFQWMLGLGNYASSDEEDAKDNGQSTKAAPPPAPPSAAPVASAAPTPPAAADKPDKPDKPKTKRMRNQKSKQRRSVCVCAILISECFGI